ncbi:hypothetical protein I6F19_34165 [Ensifer sp. BRP08]|nr:hypothetical protein [Ensifer sp. BRP08]
MNSDVHCKVNSATFGVSLLSLRSGQLKRLRRAGDRALKTTVEQTLMRVLNTHFRVFVLGCLDLPAGVDLVVIGHTIHTTIPHRSSVSGTTQLQTVIRFAASAIGVFGSA